MNSCRESKQEGTSQGVKGGGAAVSGNAGIWGWVAASSIWQEENKREEAASIQARFQLRTPSSFIRKCTFFPFSGPTRDEDEDEEVFYKMD
eukprot:gene25924-biopygen11843